MNVFLTAGWIIIVCLAYGFYMGRVTIGDDTTIIKWAKGIGIGLIAFMLILLGPVVMGL